MSATNDSRSDLERPTIELKIFSFSSSMLPSKKIESSLLG
jgi:hypothetical protein